MQKMFWGLTKLRSGLESIEDILKKLLTSVNWDFLMGRKKQLSEKALQVKMLILKSNN